MIRKTDQNLLKWIHENIIDFDGENDSGLDWTSTNGEALKFIYSIAPKERVQRFGFHSTNSHLILVDDFRDLEYCLRMGMVSESTCRQIWRWNVAAGRGDWNMDDVKAALSDRSLNYRTNGRNFLESTLKQLTDLGVMECVNPEVRAGQLYMLTEKGERILKDL